MWKGLTSDQVRDQAIPELLAENRIREDYINRSVEVILDSIHADRMADWAAASNMIAKAASTTADALKRWTTVLAVSNVVLALATIGLIVATLNV